MYFSGKRISARNALTVDKIRLATVNLNNIKIGGNVKKLSVTKSTVKKEIIDKMIIYHVGKSVATEFRGKHLRVIRIDNHDAFKKQCYKCTKFLSSNT